MLKLNMLKVESHRGPSSNSLGDGSASKRETMSTGSNGCVWISTLLLQLFTALHIGMWRIVERRFGDVWSISALPNDAANLVQQLLFQTLERDGEVDDRHLWNFRSLTCQ